MRNANTIREIAAFVTQLYRWYQSTYQIHGIYQILHCTWSPSFMICSWIVKLENLCLLISVMCSQDIFLLYFYWHMFPNISLNIRQHCFLSGLVPNRRRRRQTTIYVYMCVYACIDSHMHACMDAWIEKREKTTKTPFANHYIIRLKILPVTYTKFGFDQHGFRSKSKWTS